MVNANHLTLLVQLTILVSSSLQGKAKQEVPTHRHATEWHQLWYSNYEEFQRLTEPSFDNNTVSNITVQLGGTAFLHFRVRNLGERTISCVRRRYWYILTSGMFTYTNDERFQVLHGEGSDDWTLQIKYVQKRDNGTYECQCPQSHIYVFWYHIDRMVNYDTARGEVTVETEPGAKIQSRLTTREGQDTDSTCSASNTEPAAISIFVSEVELASHWIPATTICRLVLSVTGQGTSSVIHSHARSSSGKASRIDTVVF